VKLEVLGLLGGRCLVHGETDPNVLVIDHVRGNGAQYRGRDGCKSRLLWDIRAGRLPLSDFQVLCHNANHLKRLWCGESAWKAL
jgi:hypothetical protein